MRDRVRLHFGLNPILWPEKLTNFLGVEPKNKIIFTRTGERMMKKKNLVLAIVLTVLLGLPKYTLATSVEFQLFMPTYNADKLPQEPQTSGDYLPQTVDDYELTGSNPSGCFSFNFMNPAATSGGYAKGIHSMTGSVTLDIDLQAGGTLDITSLAFDGYISSIQSSLQRLVQPGDPAADGSHGSTDGIGNSGTYNTSAGSNWGFQANFDWYYDVPAEGMGGIDMTFDNYQWDGFIIPVSELTTTGMATTILDDSLGYFGGNFEQWLLNKVASQLPQEAAYLLFAQGQANPAWTGQQVGITTSGLVGETVVGYAIPEPATMMLLVAGLCCARGLRLSKKST